MENIENEILKIQLKIKEIITDYDQKIHDKATDIEMGKLHELVDQLIVKISSLEKNEQEKYLNSFDEVKDRIDKWQKLWQQEIADIKNRIAQNNENGKKHQAYRSSKVISADYD